MDGSDERTTRESTSNNRRQLNGVRHRLIKPKKPLAVNRSSKTLPNQNITRNNGVHLRSQGSLKSLPSRRAAPVGTNGLKRSTGSRTSVKRTGHISLPLKCRGLTGLATNHSPAGTVNKKPGRLRSDITPRTSSSLHQSCLNGGSSHATTSGSFRRPSFLAPNGYSQSTGAGGTLQDAPRRPNSASITATQRSSSVTGGGEKKRRYCRTRSRSNHSPGRKSSVGKAANTITTSPSTASRLVRSASSSALARGASRTYRRATRRSTVTSIRTGAGDSSTASSPQVGGADHEAFIRAFATPTHLYRYLAIRHRHCPLFLYRNLTYFRSCPISSEAAAASVAKRATTRNFATAPRTSLAKVVERLLHKQCQPTNRLASPPLSTLTANQLSQPQSPPALRQRPTEVPRDQVTGCQPLSPGPLSAAPMLKSPMPCSSYWPSEMQLIFEGFFDSEKELDWVTVSASVSLYLRLGWNWRHKACPSRSQLSPVSDYQPIALACHNPGLGSILPGETSADDLSSTTTTATSSPAISVGPGECRIRPMEVLRQTKLSAGHGGRLTSGQLEFRLSASERRRLKRIDSSTRVPSAAGGTVLLSSLSTGRKNGLGSVAYPVSYRTSPLPLFQPAALVSGSWTESHPLLLTPGRYELRLGIDTDDSDSEDPPSPSLPPARTNKEEEEEKASRNRSVKCRGAPAQPPSINIPGIFEKFGLSSDKQAGDEQQHPSPVMCNGVAGAGCSSGSALLISDSSGPNGVNKTNGAPNDSHETPTGRGGWRRIRFPQTSVALDEYARWPRIRFRVVWHGREPADAAPGVRRHDRLNGLVGGEPVSAFLQALRKLSPRRCSGVSNGPTTPHQPSCTGQLNCGDQTSPAKPPVASPVNRRTSRQSAPPLAATSSHSPVTTTSGIGTRATPPKTASSSPVARYPILRKTLQVQSTPAPQTKHAEQQQLLPSTTSKASVLSVRLPITYRFVYLDRVQQWSEARNLVCPWCQLDCARRVRHQRVGEVLLWHLRTCHPRFCLKPIWTDGNVSATTTSSNNTPCLSGSASSRPQSLCIEVSLNDSYDGSNDCGLRRWDGSHSESSGRRRSRLVVPPSQLVGGWTSLGLLSATSTVLADSRTVSQSVVLRLSRPMRRLPYTHLIFWRGAELAIDQSVDSTLSVRPIAQGHNRIYYHTKTVQPLRACEFDFDSEAEDAPNWLCQHYQRKVEEFTDVNQGEKQLMQVWNHLLLSVRPSQLVVCDSQLPSLASLFIYRHAEWIHARRLRCNLLLHLANLVDYGLMSASHLRQLMSLYDRLAAAGYSRLSTQTDQG